MCDQLEKNIKDCSSAESLIVVHHGDAGYRSRPLSASES